MKTVNRTWIVTGIAALLCTCNEEPVPHPVFEEFMSVYFSAAREDPYLHKLYSDRDTTIVLGSIAYGGTTDYDRQVKASVKADMSLVDAYNATNATEYLPLPSNCFSFSMTTLAITQNTSHSGVLYLNLINMPQLEKDKPYLLPVTVLADDAGGLGMDENRKTSWQVISVVDPDVVLPFNKDEWSITADNEWASTWAASLLINGNTSDYWHTAPGVALPHWVMVDMQEIKTITGFYFWHRTDGNGEGSPKALKIDVSTDNTLWETVYETDNLSQSVERLSLPLESKVKARYFKITITATRDGYEYTYFSEISAYNDIEY
jgi:hypothetical protein